MKVSLIIPAYNESQRLPAFLASIVQAQPDVFEIIVVDDGSVDNTAKVAKDFQVSLPQLQVISLPVNQGKGSAVQTGAMQAQGDIIIFMDADGATGIDELPNMLTALQSADIAIGNRWMDGASVKRTSSLRKLSSLFYRNYMSLFGLKDIDTMCGFKGYKKEVAKDLFKDLLEKRWLFDTEIAYKAVKRNYSIKNFPIKWESKDGSKLDAFTLFKSGLAVWPLIMKINKHEKQ